MTFSSQLKGSSKPYFIVLFTILINTSLKAQPVLSISATGRCIGDTLIVSSNMPDSLIIWKLNGLGVDTERKHLLNYASTTIVDTFIIDAFVDTSGNLFTSSQLVPANCCIGCLCPIIASLKKFAPGASIPTTLYSSASAIDYVGNIYVDKGDTIYYAHSDGILKLAPGASLGVNVAGGNGTGSASNQLFYPGGIFVDNNRNIYIADNDNHRVQKWAPGATSGVTVAGGNGLGLADSQLNHPHAVFVDNSGNIYVSDYGNNRVQRWATGAISGVTVAGDHWGNPGSLPFQLDGPEGIYIDAGGNLIVTDKNNNRIQEFAPSATNATTLFGGNGQGNANNQFYQPTNCLPDKNGNYYVADGRNGRVQRFADTVLPYYVPATGGYYTALITATNGGGSATTMADTIYDYEYAGVTINSLYNNSICLSYDTAQLFAHASFGGSSPTFDWYKDGIYQYTTTDSTTRMPGIANGDSLLCLIHSNFVCLNPPGFAISNKIIMTVDSLTSTQTANIVASPGNVIQHGQHVTFTVSSTYGGDGYQWYKNSNIIPGATDSTYGSSTLNDGDLMTCISHSNIPCVWNTDVISNIIVMHVAAGVGQLSNTIRDIRLFPNPNNGIFNISGSVDPLYTGPDVSVQLLDMPGKVLWQEHASLQHGEFLKQIHLDPSLANGVYLLRISTAETSQVQRFVIDK